MQNGHANSSFIPFNLKTKINVFPKTLPSFYPTLIGGFKSLEDKKDVPAYSSDKYFFIGYV
jgi:hypothetical protein